MGSVLLVDAGNTRLKWQLRRRWQAAGETDVLAHGAQRYEADTWNGDWDLPDGPSSVWVGSVAGETVNQHITDWCAGQSFPAPVFVATARESLGLRVAYRDVGRLGVDRFLAMLGARQHASGPFCVLDVGTAMTLDAVDARGMHVGGLIAPGPATMVQSLLRGTSGIRDASREVPRDMFAKDTSEAVTGGACYASAALIDQFVQAAATRFGESPDVFIAGGGRKILRPLIAAALTEAPDLVFDGLMALSMSGAPR
ncbi:MAG: type III pantothenate kinase [Pseudomonadota bacterium]